MVRTKIRKGLNSFASITKPFQGRIGIDQDRFIKVLVFAGFAGLKHWSVITMALMATVKVVVVVVVVVVGR